MLKVPKYKSLFGLFLSSFSIILLFFWTYISVHYEIYQNIEDVGFLLGIVFYTFISVLFVYQTLTSFSKPTQFDISNEIVYLDFPFSSISLPTNEIKGFSKTNFRARNHIIY